MGLRSKLDATRPCSLQTVQTSGAQWKVSGDNQHTLVFNSTDDVLRSPAIFTLVGMVAQNDSELTPLGSYNPYYDRPTYNGLQHAKWYFEVNRPADPEYALEFDYAVEALRSLQRAVSVSGRNSCLLLETNLGLGVGVQFEQELFVEQHGADVSLRNWLLWPVPYTSAKRFSNALERRSFSPLLAYHADGVAVAPADLDTKLRGSIVEASFTLHHQSLRTYDCDHFHARVKRIVVLKDGQGTPRPLKFNESRGGGDSMGEGAPDDVWFPTQVLADSLPM